ncbi:MAG: glycosyltransferase family 2 protein [Opitutaceae bacterium]
MKVSFIIPLYNRLDLTQPCLESLQQTIPRGLDHEIVLVDDGSTDGTREWIATLDAPFRVVLNESNRGYAGTNNRGALAATGDILALLNSDLILTRGWLEPMLRLVRRPRVGIVGNVQRRVADGVLDHAGILFNEKCKPAHDDRRFWLLAPRRHRRVPAVTAACLLIRRDLFFHLGGFDEAFRNGCEDIDLCFRARRLGYSVHVALRSRIGHHVSASRGENPKNEYNSRRLAHRWRDELIRLGAHHASLRYLLDYLPTPRDADPDTVWRCLLNLCGIRVGYGAPYRPWAEAPMLIEERRWAEILGAAQSDRFVSTLLETAESTPAER